MFVVLFVWRFCVLGLFLAGALFVVSCRVPLARCRKKVEYGNNTCLLPPNGSGRHVENTQWNIVVFHNCRHQQGFHVHGVVCLALLFVGFVSGCVFVVSCSVPLARYRKESGIWKRTHVCCRPMGGDVTLKIHSPVKKDVSLGAPCEGNPPKGSTRLRRWRLHLRCPG